MFSLNVRTKVYLTEDEEKVRQAVTTIFPLELKREGSYLVGDSATIKSLTILKEKLENRSIRDTARGLFLHNIAEETLRFGLNKQTAFVGVVNFLESAKLGVIEVKISSDDLQEVIDYIAPSTV
jgi:predicted RNA binding protein with dsRBD fold (UPF0201 family)